LRQDVGLQVRRAHLDLISAGETLRAADAQLRAAQLAFEMTRERYQVGAATLVELTQLRASLTQAESALVSARYSLAFQQQLIDYYVGDLNPEDISLQ
jgi:outer membrane protein